MRLWILILVGCSTPEPAPTGPDPVASAAAADAVCKLLQGAREKCRVKDSTVTWGEQTIVVTADMLFEEEKLGHSTFRARIDLVKGGQTWSTPSWGFGGSREEAFKRGFHEWAVVSGVAAVDAWIDKPERPGLAALIPSAANAEGAGTLGVFQVFRGFTLIRGEHPPADAVDHAVVIAGLQSIAPELDAKQPHTLAIHREASIDGVTLTCHIDGKPSESLCKAAKDIAWPQASVWQLKQTYVLKPTIPEQSP